MRPELPITPAGPHARVHPYDDLRRSLVKGSPFPGRHIQESAVCVARVIFSSQPAFLAQMQLADSP
jgi:hypothetical protein